MARLNPFKKAAPAPIEVEFNLADEEDALIDLLETVHYGDDDLEEKFTPTLRGDKLINKYRSQ